MRFELTLDAVKRIIFLNYNKENESSLLDKDYNICYNSNTQTIVLEKKDDKAPIKSDSLFSNPNRFNEAD